jgi:hypothetical protein
MDIINEILGGKPKQPAKTPKPAKIPKPVDQPLPVKMPEEPFKLRPFSIKRISSRRHRLMSLSRQTLETVKIASIQTDRHIITPNKKVKVESEINISKAEASFKLSNLPKLIMPNIPKKPVSDSILEISLKLKDYHLPVNIPTLPREKLQVRFEEDALLPSRRYAQGKESRHVIGRSLSPRKYTIPRFLIKQYMPESDNLGNPVIDIFNINYNIPKRTDVAVMLVFFDYVGSARILMNYLYMVEKLKLANIPVFTLELVIHEKQPKIKDAFHVYGSSYLFQKEHLLRLLEKRIPAEFTKLACLDADVLFDNPDWYNLLSEALEIHDVIHPFKEAYWLNLDYKDIQLNAESICNFNPDKQESFWSKESRCHPGFAWCFTRKWYNKVGFYDLAVIGSGDTLFAHALFEFKQLPITAEFRLYIKTLYSWWKNNSGRVRYSGIETNLYHMYHGSLKNRQYYDRYVAFKQYNNIEDIISTNKDGVYELIVPELNQHMLNFFKTRQDDGID